jgi:quercetin dioxygenase-like cupin family protein
MPRDPTPPASYVRRAFDEMPSRFGGVAKLVRADLGLTAFGVQAFDFPPDARGPEHDESSTGQEELYVGLAGGGWIVVEDEPVEIGPRVAVVVRAGTRRRTVAGPAGLSLLCVGGVPGAYRPVERFLPEEPPLRG